MYTFLLRLDELAEISQFIGDVLTYERKKKLSKGCNTSNLTTYKYRIGSFTRSRFIVISFTTY